MAQSEWRAAVTWPLPAEVEAERLGVLAQALPGFGIVATDDKTMRTEMTVEASTLRLATETALRAARAAYTTALGASGEPVAVRVLTVEAAEAEAARPAALDLIGLREVAQILGVSPQRAGQLAGQAGERHPEFPDPVARPLMGPVFTRESVEAFAKRWERRSGRPRKSS